METNNSDVHILCTIVVCGRKGHLSSSSVWPGYVGSQYCMSGQAMRDHSTAYLARLCGITVLHVWPGYEGSQYCICVQAMRDHSTAYLARL